MNTRKRREGDSETSRGRTARPSLDIISLSYAYSHYPESSNNSKGILFPPTPEINVIWLRSSWKMKSLHTETVSVFLREVGNQSELLKDIDWTMSWTWQNNEEITSSMLHKIQINGDEIIANASVVVTPPISSTTSPKVKLKLKTTFGDGVSGHPDGVCRLDGTCLWLGGWLPADVQQNGSYWRFLPNSTFGIPESTSLTLTSSVWSYTCSHLKFVGTQDAEGYYLQDQTRLFSPDDGLGYWEAKCTETSCVFCVRFLVQQSYLFATALLIDQLLPYSIGDLMKAIASGKALWIRVSEDNSC
ncbi:hypothetical protein R1flu_003152 [Riccia fluitans]|uniref:Uncharacterized protein n=1 Tax=Riccia fluitans TaxID=41844 RepID=A0ABD1Y857_9MARC